MNELFSVWSLQAWKPVLTALILPPTPWLLMVLWGAHRLARGRRHGGLLVLAGVAAMWWGSTFVVAQAITRAAGLDPAPLPPSWSAPGGVAVQASAPKTAIVVLGGGRDQHAPAYGGADLSPESSDRLRYGIWLARRTGWPLGFAGGTGWAASPGAAEAAIAARMATESFGVRLRWLDSRSRDTRENAREMLELLRPDGIEQVLLVTHAWHMPRALRAFEQAAGSVRIVPAPMGQLDQGPLTLEDWLPSANGQTRLRRALRETLGLWLGA